MKKDSGISLISVVIIVVIMIILARVAVSSGMNSVEEARDTKISVEISELKKAVADKMIEIETKPGASMPGQLVDDIANYMPYLEGISNAELNNLISGVTDDNKNNYRIVNSVSAAALGVSSIQENHYFIVDYNTGNVYGLLNENAYNFN